MRVNRRGFLGILGGAIAGAAIATPAVRTLHQFGVQFEIETFAEFQRLYIQPAVEKLAAQIDRALLDGYATYFRLGPSDEFESEVMDRNLHAALAPFPEARYRQEWDPTRRTHVGMIDIGIAA